MDNERAQLWRICEAGLAAVGYELVELEYQRDGQGWVLRVFIDHPQAAVDGPSQISHADCERASRHLSAVLDVADPIASAYRLELSSPGVHRPLRREVDFARYVGRRARLRTNELVSGRRVFVGRLLGVEAGKVSIDVDGQIFDVLIKDLAKARLDDEANAGPADEEAPRPKQARRARR